MLRGDFLRAFVRGNLRLGLTFVALGFLIFVAAGLVIGPSDDRQEELEAHGERVEGTVIDAHVPLRGPSSVTVRYLVDGTAHEVHIVGSNAYAEGETVTVYVDPSDPARATLGGEQPQNTPTYFFTLALVVTSLLLLGAGVVCLWRAWRER